MIIECPYCTTRFRLDERTIAGRQPTLRCSKCRRTFALPAQLAASTPPDEDLSFTYDDEPEWDRGSPAADPQPDEQEQFSLPVGTATDEEAGADDGDDQESDGGYDEGDGDEADQPEEPQRSLFAEDSRTQAQDDDTDDDVWVDDNGLGDDTGPDYTADEDDTRGDELTHTIQIRPVLFFLALVVSGYGLLASTLHSEPGWARSMVRQLPVIGDQLEANRLSENVELVGLHGRYERTKDGKLIFLITGQALNQHDEPLRAIRVAFQLLDQSGAVVGRQSTTCGNPLRVELIRDLTIQQVAILKGWGSKPPGEAPVNPGEGCPLVSIFFDMPETITELTGEVVQTRRIS